MKTSQEIDKLAEALAKAQGKFKNPEKNKTAKIRMKAGGEYSYTYADLPAILDATRIGLSENGLSHLCSITYDGNSCFLVGRLMHSSGQWVESQYKLPSNADSKSLAAECTYGRRYIFTAITGIAADEDTDSQPEQGGEYGDRKKAVQNQNKATIAPVIPNKVIQPASPPVSVPNPFNQEIKKILELQKQLGISNDEIKREVYREYKVDSVTKISLEQAKDFVGILQAALVAKSAPDLKVNSPAFTPEDEPNFDNFLG